MSESNNEKGWCVSKQKRPILLAKPSFQESQLVHVTTCDMLQLSKEIYKWMGLLQVPCCELNGTAIRRQKRRKLDTMARSFSRGSLLPLAIVSLGINQISLFSPSLFSVARTFSLRFLSTFLWLFVWIFYFHGSDEIINILITAFDFLCF